jgi:hypothetical protein
MMRQSIDSRSAASRLNAIYLMAVALCAFVVPAAPSFAQASGEVRVKFAKAGLLTGVGLGSGVLTYRGRDYPFRVSGTGFGFTAGAGSRGVPPEFGRFVTLPASTDPSARAARWWVALAAFI